MIWGVPVGNQTIHVDVDLSDIGCFSLRPYDLQRLGICVDGFKNKKNTPIIYNLSGATKLQELKDDLNSIATDINTFYQDLYKYKVIPSGDTEFKSDFNYQTGAVTYNELNKAPYNRFYLVWGKTVLDGKFNEIIINITNKKNIKLITE